MPSLLRVRPFGNPSGAQDLYQRHPELAAASTADQQQALDQVRGPFSSDLAEHLRARGWDVREVITGVAPLADRWRHDLELRSDASDAHIVAAAIHRLRPDVVVDQNCRTVTRQVRRAVSGGQVGRPLLVGYLGTPKRFAVASNMDLIITPLDGLAPTLQKLLGIPVRHVPHAYQPRKTAAAPTDRDIPLAMFGSLGAPHWVSRTQLLSRLLEETPIECWVRRTGPADPSDRPSDRVALTRQTVGNRIPTAPLAAFHRVTGRAAGLLDDVVRGRIVGHVPDSGQEDASLHFLASHADRVHPPVHGDEYLALLERSRIVVDRSADTTGPTSGALRLFEVTGSGALLVTEHTPWIANLFRPGEEIVTYSDAQDCVRQLHRLLADPVTVSRIAAAGQQRTLMDHSTARQSERLDAELRMLISTRR